MLSKERVLAVLQAHGPLLPVQIKKHIGEGDTFTIGALLSELSSGGKVRVSSVKRGGSPFYFVPEHKARLANFISDLGEKDRRAAEKLREHKVLRDKEQEPLVRVCLRQVKDFASPVEVKTKDGVELFWKWYLLPAEQTEAEVRKLLGIAAPVTPVVEAPAPPPAPESPSAPEERHLERQERLEPASEKPKSAAPKEVDAGDDAFLKQLLGYFAEKHIKVLSHTVLRRNTDIELVVSVPTAVGRVEYHCKAKNKKKSNEGDLSSAYVQGQLKKLPVLYVTTGEVTKKAREKLEQEFKGLVLVQL